MRNIKAKIHEHKYLVSAIVISFLIVLLTTSYLLFLTDDFKLAIGIIPFGLQYTVAIFLISLFTFFLSKKFPRISKFLSFFLNSIVLLCQLAVLSFILIFAMRIGLAPSKDANYSNIGDYNTAKKKISCSKCIKHFPKEIPTNAKNIHFYMYTSYFWGSEGIFLVFDADKNYIEQEIKKYKYKYIVQPHTDDYNPAFKNKRNSLKINYHNGFKINESDFKFYAIGSDVSFGNSGRAHEYGIGVNEKQNTIIYYYDESD